MTRSLDQLPGPRRLPLLGNAHQIPTPRFHLVLEEWAERYGPIYRADLGPRPCVVLSDRETVNTALRQRPDGYRRWSQVAQVLNEIGFEGVFTAEGDQWRRQRRLAVTALNSDHLHRYHDVVATTVERLHQRLRAEAATGGPVDLLPLFQSYTTEVICTLAFGRRPDLLGSGQDDLQPHIARIFERAASRILAPFPYWRRVKLPADRAVDRSVAALHAAVAGFIAEARARRAQDPDRAPKNFLDGMIADPESFSDAEIVGNTLTMLFAGEDTTGHSLGWAAWYTATMPAVQQRLRAEAQAVLGNEPVAAHGDALRLEYADAVVREAIRMRTPASLVGLEPISDVELHGYAIPAGTMLALLTRYIGVTGNGFAEPRFFDPDRWLGERVNGKDFLSFGAGPRVCPGRALAYLEARSALAMLVHRFDLAPEPSAPPAQEIFGFTTGPGKVVVRLTERARVPRVAAS